MLLIDILKRYRPQWLAWLMFFLTLIPVHTMPFHSVEGLPEELAGVFYESSVQNYLEESRDKVRYCQELLNFLKKEGFYSARLEQEYYDESAQEWIDIAQAENSEVLALSTIRLKVLLGELTRLDKLWIIPGGAFIDPELELELHQFVAQNLNMPASYRNYGSIQSQILKKFNDYGYLTTHFKNKQLYIYFEPDSDECRKAAWIFSVETGPRAYFGQVTYTNIPMKKGHLEELQPFVWGEAYLSKKKDLFRTALMQTGWFDDVRLLSTPDLDDPTFQNIQVVCMARMSKPFSLSGEWAPSSGVNLFVDFKFPILNRWGHQLEINVGWKNLLQRDKIFLNQRFYYPNTLSLNYTLPRFKLPFSNAIRRSDLNAQYAPSLKKRLYGCEIESPYRVTSTDILEKYWQFQIILSQSFGGMEFKGNLFSGEILQLENASTSQMNALQEQFKGKWFSVMLGQRDLLKGVQKKIFERWEYSVTRVDLKGLYFYRGGLEEKYSDLSGGWISSSGNFVMKWLFPWPSLQKLFPIEASCRAQTLILSNFAVNFKKVHPKFRCFSGGENFLIGYDLDGVAPIYPDKSYGARNGVDLTLMFFHFFQKISNIIIRNSLFFSQSFFNIFFQKQTLCAEASLGTYGVRSLIDLGAIGRLGIYIGKTLPNRRDISMDGALEGLMKGWFIRLRLEQ